MDQKTWLITGVSSGFGNEMCKQLLLKGDRVIGTLRNSSAVESLLKEYPDTFDCRILDLEDVEGISKLIKSVFLKYGTIDVVVSNAGYGLFGCVEELSMNEINKIIATNLTGSIVLIKECIPYLRKQGYGRIIQISSYGGQVAFAANAMYHATKFGIEGFCDALSQEIAKFNIGVTIVEPGGARTEFRYGSAKVAKLMDEYEHCHGFLDMLDASKTLAPGDPVKMVQRIIESVEVTPAPLRLLLGSQAYATTLAKLKERITEYEAQEDIAVSTDI